MKTKKAAVAPKKKQQGGAREGSGRKPTGNRGYLIRLPEELVAELDAEAARREMSRSAVIEERCRRG